MPIPIAWIVVSFGAGFFVGMFTERARTERKLNKIKEQIIILSNRSASIEDRHQKLLYACAMYELVLNKVSKSEKEDVRKLVEEFKPISRFLREEANTSFLERIKIKFQIENAKKDLIKEFAEAA